MYMKSQPKGGKMILKPNAHYEDFTMVKGPQLGAPKFLFCKHKELHSTSKHMLHLMPKNNFGGVNGTNPRKDNEPNRAIDIRTKVEKLH